MGSYKDEAGNKHNKLPVIEAAGRDHNGNVLWRCSCDCGKETIVTGNRLRMGHTKSCGCLVKFQVGIAAFNSLYKKYQYEAKRRNKEWRLDKDLFGLLTSLPCYYCGVEPSQETQQHQWNGSYIYNGVDRINNDVGYIPENVVPCCGECNIAKGTKSKEELITWAYTIVEKFGEAPKEI